MKRPKLPGAVQREIRQGRALKPSAHHANDSNNGLLPGWKEAKAPDGRTYYFKPETGETKWDKPAAEERTSSAGAGAPPQVPPKPGTHAMVIKQKPVIPGVAGLAKLPQGWRMITGADGKVRRSPLRSPPPPSMARPLTADACACAPVPRSRAHALARSLFVRRTTSTRRRTR